MSNKKHLILVKFITFCIATKTMMYVIDTYNSKELNIKQLYVKDFTILNICFSANKYI